MKQEAAVTANWHKKWSWEFLQKIADESGFDFIETVCHMRYQNCGLPYDRKGFFIDELCLQIFWLTEELPEHHSQYKILPDWVMDWFTEANDLALNAHLWDNYLRNDRKLKELYPELLRGWPTCRLVN